MRRIVVAVLCVGGRYPGLRGRDGDGRTVVFMETVTSRTGVPHPQDAATPLEK
jgi:hypothetical protein